jgi:threonine/homoserine/homoserine lactone efflux protein
MGETLPLALAIAASPFPIIPAILLLFSPRARSASLAFLGTFAAGVAAATSAFVLLGEVVEVLDQPRAWVSVARIVVGLMLIGWGAKQWLTRSSAGELPGWMATLGTAGPAQAARFGLILSVANPKVLLLAGAGGLLIGSSGEGADVIVLWILTFTVTACIGVAIPVGLFLVRGDRVLGPLGRARDWLQRNNSAITSVVFVLIGIALVTKGAGSL